MAKQRSPFAALSAREQQEKWLEFQSSRLPYIETALDREPACAEENRTKEKPADEKKEATPPPPPPEARQQLERQWRQLPRHGQYDRVLQRMKEAGRQAKAFQTFE